VTLPAETSQQPTSATSDSTGEPSASTDASVGTDAPSAASTTVSKDPKAAMLAFTRCLRANGVEVSDPGSDGNVGSLPTGPAADAAVKECQHLMVGIGGGQQITPELKEQILALAKCMRKNGFPDFPDPTFSDGGVGLGGAGIDRNDPKVKTAIDKCSKETNVPLGGPTGGSTP
jgi:hypothetical protein